MAGPPLSPSRCAISRTDGGAEERCAARLGDAAAFSAQTFSARRLPDRLHYRIVRCRACGLVRSDAVAAPEVIAALYRDSRFDYSDEVENLRATYGRHLRRLKRFGARPAVRPRISVDLMRPQLFAPETFDLIAMFQVLAHLPHPEETLDECVRVLRPGGLVLCINHDVEALSARLLGERSPIIDVEHTYLFSRATQARLFTQAGLEVVATGAVWNRYSLRYLCRLLPLPGRAKRTLAHALDLSRLGRLRLTLALGNLYLIARKGRA